MKKVFKPALKLLVAFFILLNIVVIFHAYKFTHYYEQNDKTVKSENEKTKWDKTKELFFGINAKKQPNIKPDSAYQTITLTTKDNLKLEAWSFNVSNSKGTIVMFHGHGGKKSSVISESAVFNKLGYNTFLLDFRAHGNSQGNTCTIGYNETEDVKLAYEYVKASGEKNICLWGISLGAVTIAKAIEDYKLEPKKMVLEMPFGSLPEAVRGRIKIMHLPQEPISSLLTFWGGALNGFWAYNFKTTEYVKGIKCPVLLQWGKNDPRVTKEETDAIFSEIKTQKKLIAYDSTAHESICDSEREKWTVNVKEFLSQ